MSLGRSIAFSLYFLAMCIGFIFGVLYLIRKEYMPYHADSVATPWSKLDHKFQALNLTFLRACGGGWLSCAIALGVLLFIPFRRGELWANWALVAVGLAESVPSFIAALSLKRKTTANPPWLAGMFAVILLLTGFIMGWVFVK